MNATVAAIEARKDARRVLDLVPNQRLIWREATARTVRRWWMGGEPCLPPVNKLVLHEVVARMSAQSPLEVVCPAGVHEGGMITVRAPDGGSFEVAVPAGVSEGQTFLVELTDGYGGLGAVAAELAEAQAGQPEPAEVLAAALRALHLTIKNDLDDLEEFVEEHCAAFASWTPAGEQSLEWTALHQQYVAMVEAGVEATLAELSCRSEDVFAYAQQHGGDPRADKVLSRLLALSEYDHFCDMMRRAHGEMVDVDDPDAGYYT